LRAVARDKEVHNFGVTPIFTAHAALQHDAN
jgi:hypothetical protein